jgi:hypothetical protein
LKLRDDTFHLPTLSRPSDLSVSVETSCVS